MIAKSYSWKSAFKKSYLEDFIYQNKSYLSAICVKIDGGIEQRK